MLRIAAIAAVVLAIAIPGYASPPDRRDISVPIVKFASITSLAHEDERAFILRTAKIAHAYTALDGHEVCSRICRAPDGRLFTALHTAMSSLGCPIVDECAPGFAPTDQTLHTHPESTPRRVTEYDVAFLRHRGDRTRARVGVRFQPAAATEFSDEDFASGPGYLVASGQVWFQAGEGTERLFGRVPD